MKRAFSLVEAMVAMLILLVGVTGLAAAFHFRSFKAGAAKNEAAAAIIAQSVARELSATNPEAWNESTIEETFRYNYQGERLAPSDSDPFYWVDVSWEAVDNWHQVEIGVLWKNWRKEREKMDQSTTADHAYILDISISAAYGDAAP